MPAKDQNGSFPQDRDLRAVTPAHFAWTASLETWIPYKHLLVLNDALLDAVGGKHKFVIVEMPPQHGKSTLISQYFPAWFVGKFPEKQLILCSHEADFAKEWGRKSRDILERWGPELFGVSVSRTNRAANRWGIDRRSGGVRTAGGGGSITGKKADGAIIDDIFKGAEQAMSRTQRDKIHDWYRTELLTRLHDHSFVVILNTRWHLDDLAGRLQYLMKNDTKSDQYRVINMPAIAWHPDEIPIREHDDFFPDPLGREPGEALCPELHDLERLNKQRSNLGTFWFSALYQGRPIPSSGGVFHKVWWRYWHPGDLLVELVNGVWKYLGKTHYDSIIQSWDIAGISEKTSNRKRSYVVGQVWASKGPKRYLLDQFRKRCNPPDAARAVEAMSLRWPMTHKKIIEMKGGAKDVLELVKHKLGGMSPREPKGDKEFRASLVTWQVEAGDVYIPDPKSYKWVEDEYLPELSSFPRGTSDDQVDATTQALLEMVQSGGGFSPVLIPRPTRWNQMIR